MTQEMYVKIKDLHARGWTIQEIAAEIGWHRHNGVGSTEERSAIGAA